MTARSLISIAVAAAALGLSTASMADNDHRRHSRHDGPRAERNFERYGYERHDRHDRYDRRDRYDRGPRHWHRDARPVTRGGYHYGPRWQRGQYLPREYRGGRYIVVQHQPRLYAPPRGHHWVQVNGEFLLIAAATGLIAHAILSN